MVRFGGNISEGFSVPLAFEDRYFIAEPGDPPLITVIIDKGGEPIFEVKRNQPVENPLTKVSSTPLGIVTVSDIDSGRYLYKIRPENELSIALGTLVGEEITVVIRDKEIYVDTNRVADNHTSKTIGVRVFRNGLWGLGGPVPARVREWMTSIQRQG